MVQVKNWLLNLRLANFLQDKACFYPIYIPCANRALKWLVNLLKDPAYHIKIRIIYIKKKNESRCMQHLKTKHLSLIKRRGGTSLGTL